MIKFYNKYRECIKYAFILSFIVVSGIIYTGCNKDTGVDGDIFVESSQETKTSSIEESKNNNQKTIYVYVCGYVNNPGVVECVEGDRVFQAIEKAGGCIDNAGIEALNIAQPVKDGERIYIPSVDEIADSGTLTTSVMSDGGGSTDKIDINKADESKLSTLPGIGQSKAKDIVDYRKTNGNFKSIEDIKNISGIKDSVFNKIKDLIKV